MFEKAPYELADPRALTEIAVNGAKEEERTYGPVFTVRFIKYALWFIAQRTGEKPTEDIKTLSQLTEYLISKSDKYPTPTAQLVMLKLKLKKSYKTKLELEFAFQQYTCLETLRVLRRVR